MTNYTMSGYELGSYMEIYLPKRTMYQPFLFDVLTKGFEIKNIREHFLNPLKRPGISEFLAGNPGGPLWGAYNKAYVAKLRPCFFGYSMYEVDGVFKGPKNRPIVEERTQILRLIFRLDLDKFIRKTRTGKENRRAVRGRISDYLRAHYRDEVIANAAGRDRRIYEAAKSWRDQIGFFVFGYIVYELCTHIEQLANEKRIGKPEDEIWVMNFANLELDRILWATDSNPVIKPPR